MTPVSDGLRWILIVGCLLLAALEAPQSSLVLLEDLRGPWRAGDEVAAAPPGPASAPIPALAEIGAIATNVTTRPPKPLKAIGACASVAPENPRVRDRLDSARLARGNVPGLVAIVLPR